MVIKAGISNQYSRDHEFRTSRENFMQFWETRMNCSLTCNLSTQTAYVFSNCILPASINETKTQVHHSLTQTHTTPPFSNYSSSPSILTIDPHHEFSFYFKAYSFIKRFPHLTRHNRRNTSFAFVRSKPYLHNRAPAPLRQKSGSVHSHDRSI